ncbi:universal stress protein [Shewanella sp. WXL01]|uniref:Universal stress protein n=1 Tax=Shewanella maritima TaxID=2520507 RepID=A0A411PL91_9GAMM|nr:MULTISPECIES: universal stress protein [Shewanella]NKF52663.1 universal stress protein [Shewanella sp. WXL01]QBF84289.1 universal stress protein [Shewanella maritima]
MYKTILCAVEVGEEGDAVIAKAKQLAEKFDSELILISVLPYSFLPKDYQKELEDKAIPEFEAFALKHDVVSKKSILKVGKPYVVICDQANYINADLIVLGTHSKSGISSLLGSTATGVSNQAHCDVSLVRI